MGERKHNKDYYCWLAYSKINDHDLLSVYQNLLKRITVLGTTPIIESAKRELIRGISGVVGIKPHFSREIDKNIFLIICKISESNFVKKIVGKENIKNLSEEGFLIKSFQKNDKNMLLITSKSNRGILYGVFRFLNILQMGMELSNFNIISNPANSLRMINHWDNLDGSIERGYAGGSILYNDNQLTDNIQRVRDYARLLASVGINSIVINNVNVHREESRLIGDKIGIVKSLSNVFRDYGIKTFLSINFASSVELGGLSTADPLNTGVRNWWKARTAEIYNLIPDFGGFLVKADSEHRPGPFTYGRSHAEGANMLAEPLKSFGGLLIWRCFVYNCHQDWRDYETDRARAAYDNFMSLDGKFNDNVVLQIKNGPMDFQVREPVSPLFGGLKQTNQNMELQITQEYTGQQRHLCYLVPQWKEILEFDTFAKGKGSTIKRIIDGSVFPARYSGLVGVINVGDDENWTGHTLAQANFYGFGRLGWNPDLSAEKITREWVRLTFGSDPDTVTTISEILLNSWVIYENYTSPLGIGWMVNPGHHYGPNVDGYEYSPWGTYHRADHLGIGVDRTVKTGTAYTGQYFPENALRYESREKCPEELLLFFHHLPYTYRLKTGKTLIQHIYDSHFEGVEQVKELRDKWINLRDKINPDIYKHVLAKFNIQLEHSKEWCDVINSYFYRKSGIPDQLKRKIY
ncbi:MAG: alpha-glucuronidase [Firmicutes bacterium]|nr:alpha-glucuronidase [Bacillota bacterium]